jgi:tetratricopeptide (TPR) repeat protein
MKPPGRLLLLTLAMGLSVSLSLHANSGNIQTHKPVPVADTIVENNEDSILTQLNLDYLNGVNNHHTPFELIPIIEEILVLDPLHYTHWFNLGLENMKIHKYNLAIIALERGLALYPASEKRSLVQVYASLSFCYNKVLKHQKEKEILDTASRYYPDHPGITGRYAICAHSRMRYHEAEAHLQDLTIILRKEGYNESDIAFYIGKLYLNNDYLEAEKYFRVALQYDPQNVEKQGALAWVLIRNALKINEGMDLIEQAIAADPDNPTLLHQQGYGFYVKGRYQEALFNLYRARDLYIEYNYDLFGHIRLVEDAIARSENQLHP